MAFDEMVREKLLDDWIFRFGPIQQCMRFAFLDAAMRNRHVLFEPGDISWFREKRMGVGARLNLTTCAR